MSKPLILAIDDVEDEVRPIVPDADFEVEIVEPDDINLSGKLTDVIESAVLILLDQKFNAEPNPLSLTAADGASFVSHLRSWSRKTGKALAPIILVTNDDQAFANEIPAIGATLPLSGSFLGREFQVAPALDVEWVQHKIANDARTRIQALAHASLAANEIVGADGASLEEIERLLDLSTEVVWYDKAREELRSARPPVSQRDDIPATQCGPSHVIRWLCHRALPYPGMFFSDLYAAWSLGISLEGLHSLADTDMATPWLKDFNDAEYSGPLCEFAGRRWWRAGIAHLVWTLDQEASKLRDHNAAWASLAPGTSLGELRPTSTRVVAWTPTFTEHEIIPIDNAVQLHPPGWPAEALDPWLAESDTKNDKVLQAMIEAADL